MHSGTLFTRPNRKDSQPDKASHLSWHAAAVSIPEGWERGVALPLPSGAAPQVSRALRRGVPETMVAAKRAEAAMMVVNGCMVKFGMIFESVVYEGIKRLCFRKLRIEKKLNF